MKTSLQTICHGKKWMNLFYENGCNKILNSDYQDNGYAHMIDVKKITDPENLQQAFAIRDQVFVQEQGCPADLEHEHDEIAIHFLATADTIPAGAARWRKTGNGFKLERFAVLPQYRGKGIATAMIKAVLNDLPDPASPVYLNAQTDAVALYEKNGFTKVGDEFEEAGIKHYKMIRQ